MTLDSSRRPTREPAHFTVEMKSRGNQRVVVDNRLDAQFLELADEFALKAARILEEEPPGSRRSPRRRPRPRRAQIN